MSIFPNSNTRKRCKSRDGTKVVLLYEELGLFFLIPSASSGKKLLSGTGQWIQDQGETRDEGELELFKKWGWLWREAQTFGKTQKITKAYCYVIPACTQSKLNNSTEESLADPLTK